MNGPEPRTPGVDTERLPARPAGGHPAREELERFMRGEASRTERRAVARHLLAGCARCAEVTGRLWELGEQALVPPGVEVGRR